MRVTIQEATDVCNAVLRKIGFTSEEAALVTRNVIEAELAERSTHGIIRIVKTKKEIELKTTEAHIQEKIISESPTHLHIDALKQSGYITMYRSLDKAYLKAKTSGIVMVGLKNVGYATGFIGDYAREATKRGFIFIGLNSARGGLIPHGAIKELFGTNPLTIGIPTKSQPVILDMATSQITWGELLVAKSEGKKIKNKTALDPEGNYTTDANKAFDNGLLPIAAHKGSGLAFVIEILAGGLTGSRMGYSVPGEAGVFYILIDPTLFRHANELTSDVQKFIDELKALPKAKGVKEIYYAGEQSAIKRENNLAKKSIKVPDTVWKELNAILEVKEL